MVLPAAGAVLSRNHEICYFDIYVGVTNMKPMIKFVTALLLVAGLLTNVGCAATPKEEGTGEYVDDTVITTKVKTAILNESTLKVSEINVETFKGIVQLSGFVSKPADVQKAAEVAHGVPGVKSVKNDIRIK